MKVHRGLLVLARSFITRAVQDLGTTRYANGGAIAITRWVSFAERCLKLQAICEPRPGHTLPPTPEEVAEWLAEVSRLRETLGALTGQVPEERRLDALLEQVQALDWNDITVWQMAPPRKGYR